MKILRPIPRYVSRLLSLVVLAAWLGQMGLLIDRAYLRDSGVNLAGDLARYGASAQWKGVYYRGEKIGFFVTQTVPTDDGYEMQEDGRLQMSLLGAATAARMRTAARVDKTFMLRSFSFSLDPGTGPIEVRGDLDKDGLRARLRLSIITPSGTRMESRELSETPLLSLNLSRRLAAAGLSPGRRLEASMFDPATMRNAPMVIDVQAREIVQAAGLPVPAFRVQTRFSGITSTSWVTDLGEVVREESPMGLIVLKETRDRATALAVPGEVQIDMLQAAAVVPRAGPRIDDPASVEFLRLRLESPIPSGPEREGAGQTVSGDIIEIRDPQALSPGPADPEARRYLVPEPLIESDAPEILAEARKAIAGASEAQLMAERLVRHVNAILEKKPTVSLPSALEVLRTRVGDCNEHTALYVAMARALGIPSRIAVGLVHLHGAFYYHAWPEVYVDGAAARGRWLAVDPTLNQFPADLTHVRLARGGLDRQAAILPLMGQVKITVLEVRVRPGSIPILVGRSSTDMRPIDIPLPRRDGSGAGCWSRPAR